MTDRPTDRPTDWTTDRPNTTDRPTDRLNELTTDRPTEHERTNGWGNEWMREWMKEWMNEWMNETLTWSLSNTWDVCVLPENHHPWHQHYRTGLQPWCRWWWCNCTPIGQELASYRPPRELLSPTGITIYTWNKHRNKRHDNRSPLDAYYILKLYKWHMAHDILSSQ